MNIYPIATGFYDNKLSGEWRYSIVPGKNQGTFTLATVLLQDGLILLDLWVLPSDLEEDHPTVRRLGFWIRLLSSGCVQSVRELCLG